MSSQKHEFFQYMASLRRAIGRDYEIVKNRSKEDPGTAGDQVEEQWAEILRSWLPATFPVVTKGRILFEDRSSSPQVDILVLKPSYPLALRKQKYIFSGGVLAAFECKLTLRGDDVREAFRACSLIKRKSTRVLGTSFDELCKPPIFGLLAHTHNMKTKKRESRLYETIEKCQTKFAQHSSELIDVICVAEEATIPLSYHLLIGPNLDDDEKQELADAGEDALISTTYVILTRRLAYHEPSIRDWADHLSYLGFYGGIGRPIYWTADELSTPVFQRLRKRGSEDEPWSRWSRMFP